MSLQIWRSFSLPRLTSLIREDFLVSPDLEMFLVLELRVSGFAVYEMSIGGDITLIIILVILIVVLYIGYAIYSVYENLPIIDCTRFGTSQGLPDCPPGTQDVAGICYYDTWSASGGTHTAATCHVSYPDCKYVGCAHLVGSSEFPNGTPCSSKTIPGWDDTHFGPGWYLTGVDITRYCHRGGDYGIYCEDAGIPSQIGVCPVGDKYGGVCWGPEKCADSRLVRSSICGCSSK